MTTLTIMVKLASPKPNIMSRIKARNVPTSRLSANVKPMPKDKGKYVGSCNRSACLRPGANWYNHGSYAYYCARCAHELNEDPFNKREAMQLFGHDLCTEGEFDPNWDYKNKQPKNVTPEPS